MLVGVVLLGLGACAVTDGGPGLDPEDVAGDRVTAASDEDAVTSAAPDDAEATSADPGTGSDLTGTFISTGITGHELVQDSVVRMTFEGDQLSVQAGCNRIFGQYAVEDGTLTASQLATTQMACSEDLMAQDDWLTDFLSSGPEVTQSADGLVLSGGGVELTLTDRMVAESDLALERQTWVLNTVYTQSANTNIRGMENTALTFEGGQVQLDTGCNTGGGTYTLDGDALTLGPMRMTLMACPDPAMEIETLMTSVLSQMDLTVELEASTLKLTAPDGTALGFVAAEEGAAGDDASQTSAP